MGTLVLITEDYYEMALDLARRSFMKDETLCKALNMEWGQEFESMWMSVLQKNLSVMLINEEDKDVMGFRTLMFEKVSDVEDSLDDIKDDDVRKLQAILGHMAEECKIYQHYNVNEIAHFFAICVNSKYRRRGIGEKLMSFAMDFLSRLGISPLCIRADGTSKISQRIFEKLEFDQLLEVVYNEFIYNNEVPFCNTGEHKTIKSFGKLLNCD